MASDCLFCAIVAGDIPATVVRDDATLAFRDLNPQAPTHVLVITKAHHADVAALAAAADPDAGRAAPAAAAVAEDEGIAGRAGGWCSTPARTPARACRRARARARRQATGLAARVDRRCRIAREACRRPRPVPTTTDPRRAGSDQDRRPRLAAHGQPARLRRRAAAAHRGGARQRHPRPRQRDHHHRRAGRQRARAPGSSRSC